MKYFINLFLTFLIATLISQPYIIHEKQKISKVEEYKDRASEVDDVFKLKEKNLIYKDGNKYKTKKFEDLTLEDTERLFISGSDFDSQLEDFHGNMFVIKGLYKDLNGVEKVLANYILVSKGFEPLESNEELDKKLENHMDLLEYTESQENIDNLYHLTRDKKIVLFSLIYIATAIVFMFAHVMTFMFDELPFIGYMLFYIPVALENHLLLNYIKSDSYFIILIFLVINTLISFLGTKILDPKDRTIAEFEEALT